MDQQHSGRAGRQGRGKGQKKGRGPRRRKTAKRRAAASAEAAASAAAIEADAASAAVDAEGTAETNDAAETEAGGVTETEAEEMTEKLAEAPIVPSPSSQGPPRRGRTDGVPQESAVLYRVQARHPLLPSRFAGAFSWLPHARLTALGSGLLAMVLMMLAGGLDGLLLDGSTTAYGTAFLLVSLACAAWVRPAELFTPPVAVPLAFTVGIFFISGGAGSGGFKGHLMGLFPALALNAVWLYAGTLVALFVGLVRKLALIAQRSRAGTAVEVPEEAGTS